MRSFHLGHLAHGCSMGVPTWGALPARLKSILLLAMCGIYMRVLIIICNPGKQWPWSVPVKKRELLYRELEKGRLRVDGQWYWGLLDIVKAQLSVDDLHHPCLHKIIRNLQCTGSTLINKHCEIRIVKQDVKTHLMHIASWNWKMKLGQAVGVTCTCSIVLLGLADEENTLDKLRLIN